MNNPNQHDYKIVEPPKTRKRKLSQKQKAFIKELVDNPKQSASQAALKAYSTPDKQITVESARNIAHNNLKNPRIISKLQDFNELVESALINTVRDWGEDDTPRKREIALDSAKYIHDKVHGKATQRIEQKSEVVRIAIDMSAKQ